MFAFNTTATLHHVTVLPPDVPFDRIVAQLHNHELLMRLDPEFVHYETLSSDPATPDVKRYKVTDHMNALPKGLWDTTVSFEAELTDLEDGILWVIKAPLGLVQKTTWRALKTASLGEEDTGRVAAGDGGEWSLVEDVEIKANRMLVGTVKGKCEANWPGAHAKFVAQLRDKAVKS